MVKKSGIHAIWFNMKVDVSIMKFGSRMNYLMLDSCESVRPRPLRGCLECAAFRYSSVDVLMAYGRSMLGILKSNN